MKSNLGSNRIDFDIKFWIDLQLFVEGNLPPRKGQILSFFARFSYLNDIEMDTKISYDFGRFGIKFGIDFDIKFEIESDRFLISNFLDRSAAFCRRQPTP